MKKSILLLVLLFISISFAQKNKKVKGNGVFKTVAKNTSEYSEVSVAGSFYVELISGNEGIINISGDENIIDLLDISVKNGKLNVSFTKDTWIENSKKNKLSITIPIQSIDKISFTGSGTMTSKDVLATEVLDVTITGSGNIKLNTKVTVMNLSKTGSGNCDITGTANKATFTTTGSGNLNADNFEVANTTAIQSGSGNLKVNCTKQLVARTAGSGNIKYKGNPEKIDKQSAGSGNISSF